MTLQMCERASREVNRLNLLFNLQTVWQLESISFFVADILFLATSRWKTASKRTNLQLVLNVSTDSQMDSSSVD